MVLTRTEIGLAVGIPLFEGFGRQYNVRRTEALAKSRQAEPGNTPRQPVFL